MELAWDFLFTKFSEEQPSECCVILPTVGRLVSKNEFLDAPARLRSWKYTSTLLPPSLKPLIVSEISFKARLYTLCELAVVSSWSRYIRNISEDFIVMSLTRPSFDVIRSLLKRLCLIISWKLKLYDDKLVVLVSYMELCCCGDIVSNWLLFPS